MNKALINKMVKNCYFNIFEKSKVLHYIELMEKNT